VNDHDRFLGHLSSDALDDADRAHATGCRECRALLPVETAAVPSPTLDAIHARALEALRATPLRPWRREAALLAGLNAVVAVAATLLLGSARWHASDDRARMAATGALLFGTLTLGEMAALDPRRRHSVLFLALAFLLPVGLLLSGHGWTSPLTVAGAMPCAITIALTALVPLVATLFVLRRMAFDGRRAAALALAAGATGLFGLHWHCLDGSALHLLGFHALPWLSLAVLVVALRRLLPTESHVP
jgi:hypothetical protein